MSINAVQPTHGAPPGEQGCSVRTLRAMGRLTASVRQTGLQGENLERVWSGQVMRSSTTLSDAAPRHWRVRPGEFGGVPGNLAKAHIGSTKVGSQLSGPLRDDAGRSAVAVMNADTGGSTAYDPLGREGCCQGEAARLGDSESAMRRGGRFGDPGKAGVAQNGDSGRGR